MANSGTFLKTRWVINTTPLSRPKKMKVQLAPCQNPMSTSTTIAQTARAEGDLLILDRGMYT